MMDSIWFLLQPSSSLLLLLFAGTLLLWVGWQKIWPGWEKAGRITVLVSALALFSASFLPLGNILLMPLEDRFPQPVHTGDEKPIDGIVVLGGAVDLYISSSRGVHGVNDRADRLIEAEKLARKYPKSKIVVESLVAGKIFNEEGFDSSRLIVERRPRNTFEGAKYLTEKADRKAGERWVLVTSAHHMPRAIGAFRKAGFDIEPWPVDYRTSGRLPKSFRYFFDNPSEGLYRTDLAAKEWVGLLTYWLAGRTSALYPGPTG